MMMRFVAADPDHGIPNSGFQELSRGSSLSGTVLKKPSKHPLLNSIFKAGCQTGELEATY
jgi:hypothetical protein